MVVRLNALNFVPIEFFLTVGFILIFLAICSILYSSEQILFILICNEIVILGLLIMFLALGCLFNTLFGELIALVLIVVSAVETALILLLYLYAVQSSDYRLNLNV